MEKDEDTEKREEKRFSLSTSLTDRILPGLDTQQQAIAIEEVFCLCLPLA